MPVTFAKLEQEKYIRTFVRSDGRSLCINRKHPTLTVEEIVKLADDFFWHTYQIKRRGKYTKWYIEYFWYSREDVPIPSEVELDDSSIISSEESGMKALKKAIEHLKGRW